ncbi:hypothetical protein ACFVY4_27925 [Streptomyces sp. NPDC058299]|uniref:hypothetical protein n=1 Tax=Streptomyces sp. NPDC058299 TaxID=3346435 RepID=UPI0036F09E1E
MLQGLEPYRVIALGTVSRSLAPALRIGWMVCPPGLIAPLAERKHRSDRGATGLDQHALPRFIQSGRFDRHLRACAPLYAARRTALLAALAEQAPRVAGHRPRGRPPTRSPTCPPAPTSATSPPPAPARCYGMSAWRASHAGTPAQLVLGFGKVSERHITAGIAAIGGLLRGEARLSV